MIDTVFLARSGRVF